MAWEWQTTGCHAIKRTTFPSRAQFARPLLAVVCGLMLVHICIVAFLPHAVLASNVMQLVFPLLVVGVALHRRATSISLTGRRCWSAVAAALTIWAAAQGLYIYFLFVPAPHWVGVRPDDALWVLFGLPLLLAVNTSSDEVDRVAKLDRAQAIYFFVVLYLLVFLPSGRMTLTNAYLIQNLALILCCLLRLPSCTLASERRFFTRLALFLLTYGSMETLGELLYRRGWQIGSPVDLIWTLPNAVFLVLILRDDLLSPEKMETSRLASAARSMQGLSVAALAFLSIGISALLATRRPALGGIFVVGAFGLFALRTNARERAWHSAHGKLEETVLQDALTGIGNRTLLRNSLQHRLVANGGGSTITLIFADLDGFKSINDCFGHTLGDQLLIQIAKRLRLTAPADAVICRHGGDEFVILTSAQDAAEAHATGDALLKAMRTPYEIGDHTLRCSASIGVVLAVEGESADDLLRAADHAMYRAKQVGKDRVQLFDTSLRAEMSSRWQMEADLRQCIENQSISVAFQPILSVESGEISGFEALARWSHPQHGSIPPAEFIPLAEESGLILALGAQVLEKACRQVAFWNHAWNTQLSLSVNVSPHQFADTGLITRLLSVLEATGFAPELLRLEITESALLVQEGVVKRTLEEARRHGIRISLDDFGTGYSSLAFLLRLPVDEVKVDRSFVSDMRSDPQRKELVRTVVHLGQSLGKRVVAEGVETEQDLRDLADMGCECAQGWLISRPLSAEVMETTMASIAARSAQTAQTMQASARRGPRLEDGTGWGEALLVRAGAL